MTPSQAGIQGSEPSDSGDDLPDAAPGVPRSTSLFAAALLIVMAVAMVVMSSFGRREVVLESEQWRPVWLSNPLGWLAAVLIGQFWLAAAFAFMGTLVPLITVLWPRVAAARWRWLCWLLGGVVLVELVRWGRSGHVPSLLEFVVPLVGFFVGAWLADRYVRRDFSWRRPLITSAVVLLVVVGLVAIVVPPMVSRTPLDIPHAEASDEAKQHVAELIDDSRPHGLEARKLRLAEADLNTLVGVIVARGGAESAGRARLSDDAVDVELTLRLPRRIVDGGYLNVTASAMARIDDKGLSLDLTRLTIGELNVPGVLLRFLSPALVHLAMEDRDARSLIRSIAFLHCDEEAVTVVLKPGQFSRDVVPAMVSILGGQPNVAEATELYVRHLVDVADDAPAGEARFAHAVESVFELAEIRSRRLAAKRENRAAIFALAIVFGHGDVETLVGRVTDDALRDRIASLVGTVTLEGRKDWARHWLVSAAIEVTGIADASEQLGTFKEEIDAGERGSGFSFADLAADRAGTRFAVAATRDNPAAQAIQDRVAKGFVVADFCPPLDDLPEGLSEAQFAAEYGDTDDPRYHELVAKIDERISACVGLK